MDATTLPTSTVAFLFTDIERSTRLWEQHPEAMRQAISQHDTLLQAAIAAHQGHLFKTMGDAFCAVFPKPRHAAYADIDAQYTLPKHLPQIHVRIALHTGDGELRERDYFGPALNRVARLLTTRHGGQVLLSPATVDRLRSSVLTQTRLRPLGTHRLRDIAATATNYQLQALKGLTTAGRSR